MVDIAWGKQKNCLLRSPSLVQGTCNSWDNLSQIDRVQDKRHEMRYHCERDPRGLHFEIVVPHNRPSCWYGLVFPMNG